MGDSTPASFEFMNANHTELYNFLSEQYAQTIFTDCSRATSLKVLAENCCNVINVSRSLNIDKIQVSIENWLLDILREIYKLHPAAFSPDIIETLKSLSHSTTERLKLNLYRGTLIAGHFIITKNAVRQLEEFNGNIGLRRDPCYKWLIDGKELQSHLEFHKRFHTVFLSTDTNTPAADVAPYLIQKVAHGMSEIFKRAREARNLPQAELRVTTAKRHRVTHCYECKIHLESGSFLECTTCNWLVCSCGACGCGYSNA